MLSGKLSTSAQIIDDNQSLASPHFLAYSPRHVPVSLYNE